MNDGRMDALRKGLESERALYERLLEVMKRELNALCSEENRDSLVSLLKEKLSLFEQLQQEDSRIADVKSEWKSLAGEGTPERIDIETLLRRLEALLRDILDIEEKSRAFIESFQSDIEVARSASRALRAARAYGAMN